jgi:hypothetical protein
MEDQVDAPLGREFKLHSYWQYDSFNFEGSVPSRGQFDHSIGQR